jgi:hypothetical protein
VREGEVEVERSGHRQHIACVLFENENGIIFEAMETSC